MNRLIRLVRYWIHRHLHPVNERTLCSQSLLERELDWAYYARYGEHPNLQDPATFNEKMQWLKIHDAVPLKTICADKLAVRPYVAQRVDEEVLPQVFRTWERAEDVDFQGLPASFVLKANHGSGMMSMVNDMAAADMQATREACAQWLDTDFALTMLERWYSDIPRKVFAEELLDDIEWEYQVWCFNGKARYVGAMHDPHGSNEKQFFTPDWKRQPFVSSLPILEGDVERPDNLETLLNYSERLAADFAFVRVDWYSCTQGLRFSELTFTPAGGFVQWTPREYDAKLGALLNLPAED